MKAAASLLLARLPDRFGSRALFTSACWLALGTSPALAYSDAVQFALDPLEAGGGGRFYTSSPADGYGCDSCHTGAESPDMHIEGLPTRYVIGATYELTVHWPRSLEHAAATLELTDEEGRGAGTLALPPISEQEAAELCEPASDGVLAAELYDAARGRTIAATADCGAFQLRVQWTAPERSAGPVWLAASVLASNHDGDVTGDGVTVFAQPIPAYGDGQATDAGAGCSSIPIGTRTDLSWVWSAGMLVLVLARRTVRARSATRAPFMARFAPALSALTLLGCGDARLPQDDQVELTRGQAVKPWDDGRDNAVPAEPDAGASVADAGITPADAGDAGSNGFEDAGMATGPTRVVFRVTTLPQGGRYAPKNIGAIWVEDEEGRWIKTLARWAGRRMRYLAAFNAANPEKDITDAITSATLRMHETHEVTWDLRDVEGKLVPDGSYAIVVEVSDRDSAGRTLTVPFAKSGEPNTVRIEDSAYFAAVELAYE